MTGFNLHYKHFSNNMEDLNIGDFLECISGSSSTGLDEKGSRSLSPMESDKTSVEWHNEYSELNLEIPDPDYFWLTQHETNSQTCKAEDSTPSVLCSLCHRNFVTAPEVPKKKRKRTEQQSISSTNSLCEECLALPPDKVNTINAPLKAKRTIRRQQAKNRSSDTVQKLQQEQEKLKTADLPEAERKRRQQMIRNRISAQQSRDRKKAYVAQLEEENQEVKNQNAALKHKLKQLYEENLYLKNQLTQIHLESSERTIMSRTAKGASLALATVLSVMMLVNTLNTETTTTTLAPRQLTSLDLSNYKNPQGVSVQETCQQALEEAGVRIEDLVPEYKEYREDTALQLREERIASISHTPSFRTVSGVSSELREGIKESGLTTVFCPNVQAYWEGNSELQYLQVLIPQESLPAVAKTSLDPTQRYMLELICKVSDVNIKPY